MSFNQSGENAQTIIGTYNDVMGNQTNDNSKITRPAFHPIPFKIHTYYCSQGSSVIIYIMVYPRVRQSIDMRTEISNSDKFFDQVHKFSINDCQYIFNFNKSKESALDHNPTITYE